MRICTECKKEDRPWFEQAPCSCGAAQLHEEDPSPLKHKADCKAIGHDVVRYPVRIERRDLTFDGKLPSRYTQRGWALWQSGNKLYRRKLLCRDCVELENGAQERKRDYEKACKAAQGLETMTYAQMLASQ